MTNKDLYKTSEYDEWANRSSILVQERYFLEKYLTDREASVLDAGTGGGRIAFALEKEGFNDISAYDYVEEMIDTARQKSQGSRINFRVADASDLSAYGDDTFDAVIYLQQIISFLPHHLIPRALAEAYRIMRPNGIAIFSFLNYNGRWVNRPLSSLLSITRLINKHEADKHQLPWLKLGGKINWKLFGSDQPLTYWFTKKELQNRFETMGMEVLEIKTSSDFTGSWSEGMLYFVCRKKGLR